jgi:hypothetical protein
VTHPQSFSSAQLESICKALADTSTGLTGSEIGNALLQVGVSDPDPAGTKWKRLYNALVARQNRDRHGGRVPELDIACLDVPGYSGDPEAGG